MSFEEKCVLVVFFLTAFLWIFCRDLTLGFVSIPGWSGLLPDPKVIDDGTVAIFMAMLLFFVPTRGGAEQAKSATILDASVFQNLPWGIILLFGGGFALAKGFQVTGLAAIPVNEWVRRLPASGFAVRSQDPCGSICGFFFCV